MRRLREFVRRDQEQIEPIAATSLVPDAEGEEPRGPTASHVPLDIREVVLRPRSRDAAVPDEAPARSRDAPEFAEEPAEAGEVAGEAEVVPEHQDGMERPQAPWQSTDARLVHVREAPDASEGHLGRRRVDADDVEPFLLEEDRVAAGAAAEVKGAPAGELDCLPFHPLPLAREG